MALIAVILSRAVAFTYVGVLLAGCAASRERPLPSVSMPLRWTAPTASPVEPTQALWWRGFGDPTLDLMIEDALRTNNDLAMAAIRVHRAHLQAQLTDTNLTPEITVGTSGNVARKLDNHRTTRGNSASGSLSYELDLWGRLTAQRDVARWEVEATQADLDAARLSLIGTTAALYWQVGYLNEQITLGDANVAYAEQTLRLVRSSYRTGALSALDVAQAEQGVLVQRAAQTQLIQQRAESRAALAILFDRPPQQQAPERASLPDAALPGVKAGLPADLLGRRPDLRAAEFRLRESLSNVELTRTSFYPSFMLTGRLDTSSASLEQVLLNPIATLGLGIALPFIQWNTKQLQINVSQTRYEEAVVDFRQKLYNALSEVEKALSARGYLGREAELRTMSLAQAQRAEGLAKARFKAGATGVKPWLDQQQLLRDAQGAQSLNQLNRLNNQMNLYMALGGG